MKTLVDQDGRLSAEQAYEAAQHDLRASDAVARTAADAVYQQTFQDELNRLYDNRVGRGELAARPTKKGKRK